MADFNVLRLPCTCRMADRPFEVCAFLTRRVHVAKFFGCVKGFIDAA